MLKALLLRKKINEKTAQLEALREKNAEFEQREAEYAQAIVEVTEETTEEERSALDEAVETFSAEYSQHRDAVSAMEEAIAQMQAELAEEEARQNTTPPARPEHTERRENTTMPNLNTRSVYRNMSIEQRESLIGRQEVRDFLDNVRQHIFERRAISNVGLTIPEVITGLLREVISENSKLYKHVNVVRLKGDGRQVILGALPEGVWTDCCGQLNELTLGFYGLDLDCNKVGGFFAICNANAADSDLNLLAEVVQACGIAIGKALDRGIVYGTGTKMPLGIVTRLAQESEPGSYPTTARPWEDLHSNNVGYFNSSGMTAEAFFQNIGTKIANASPKYSSGEKVWVMNAKTHMKVASFAINFTAGGALVSAVGDQMPVFGGVIEEEEFMADGDILFGYFDDYTLGEREGVKVESSEHVRFLQDQTVVKGTARYDGAPAIAEAFALFNINNTSPATTSTFPADGANTVSGILLPATASVASGATLALQAVLLPLGIEAPVTWTSATTAKATVNSTTGVVTGVASGSSVITATAGGKTATCTVTVTNA